MEFDWREAEKEKFYQKVERQLKKAGIDFVETDRECVDRYKQGDSKPVFMRSKLLIQRYKIL